MAGHVSEWVRDAWTTGVDVLVRAAQWTGAVLHRLLHQAGTRMRPRHNPQPSP